MKKPAIILISVLAVLGLLACLPPIRHTVQWYGSLGQDSCLSELRCSWWAAGSYGSPTNLPVADAADDPDYSGPSNLVEYLKTQEASNKTSGGDVQ